MSACSGLGSLLGAGAASRRHSNTLGVAYPAAHKSNHNEEEKKKMKKKEVRVFDISVYWPSSPGFPCLNFGVSMSFLRSLVP